MGLTFADNTIQNFDVAKTLGDLFFLEANQVFERDTEGAVTDVARETRVTLYSSGFEDQIDVSINPDFDVSGFEYDEKVVLTGEIKARAWLNTYEGYNNSVQAESAFKIYAEGLKKANASPAKQSPPKQKDEEKK